MKKQLKKIEMHEDLDLMWQRKKTEEHKGRKTMILIILYVLISASGLLLLKIGANHEFNVSISKEGFGIKVNWQIILGMLFYICSFLVSLMAMKRINLSIFYPISSGLGYVVICIISYLVLKETISIKQFVGMVIILIGVVVINLR